MEKAQKFYLGVEGGATKSTAILADEKGVLLEKVGPMVNYHSIGEQKAKANLSQLLKPFLKKVTDAKLYAVFGLAGLDTKGDEVAYGRIIKSVLPRNAKFLPVNDMNIALEAKCPNEENRIIVIAGTGSTVYGESGNQNAKTIGWDFVLGDEGSGYEVGIKVLKAATQSWDGRIKKSTLENLVLQKAGVSSMEDFIPKFYNIINDQKQDAKSYIASFAPLLDKAILKNDEVAIEIRKQTIDNLLLGAATVAKKLKLERKQFCVGFIGSLWKMPGLQQMFQKQLKRQFPGAEFSAEPSLPVWGAVLLTKTLAEK